MIKILTIIGARPQILKAAAISRAIKKTYFNKIDETIAHTGQHYDKNMSDVFFDELEIPKPNINLNVGSASHGVQTAQIIVGVEEIISKNKPDYIILYGDTNSTLAAAIAASKLHVPIVHIEAGLRSFNKRMPEEINRIMCDHASTLLFTPTLAGYNNLLQEGFRLNQLPYTADNQGVFHCGDVMYDNSLHFSDIAGQSSNILEKNRLKKDKFVLATIHRPNNTSNKENLNAIFSAFVKIVGTYNIDLIIPLHPRTKSYLNKSLDKELYNRIKNNNKIRIIEPVSFFDIIELEKNAKIIITDSGGLQKEAYFFKKPCIIMREQTEWVEIIRNNAAILTGADTNKIMAAYDKYHTDAPKHFPEIFGNGKAAEFICKTIIKNG